MKPVLLCGNPPAKSAPLDAKVNWLLDFAGEVIRNSKIDAMTIAQDYQISHLPATPVRTLDISTITPTELADVVGQFLTDLQNRGANNR